MKHILKIILSIIVFAPIIIKADYFIEYSEWSTTYPSNVDEMRIVSEDRYLWSKEVYNEETGQMETITTTEYYKELKDYEKIESSKVTYYRYILNDFILTDSSGKIQETIDYCIKNPCIRKYLPKNKEEEKEEVEEKIVNPKTGDNSLVYFSVLVINIMSIILLVAKRKSSFVESL